MKKIKVFGLLLCLSTLLSGCTNVIDERGYEDVLLYEKISSIIIGNWEMVRLGDKEINNTELLVTLAISADHKIIYDYKKGEMHEHRESDLHIPYDWHKEQDLLVGSIQFYMWGDALSGYDTFKCVLNNDGKEMILIPNDGVAQVDAQAMYFEKRE